jgi:hypothetical protein
MKARALKKILNDTGYIIHETSELICVGSPLCHDLISIRKDTLKMRYALDAFHKGKASIGNGELLAVWETLERLIATGEIHKIIAGKDVLENPLPVFSHDGDEIIHSFTDEYGWPNTDIEGRLMYDNTWFATEKEAIARAISDCQGAIRWRTGRVEELRAAIAKLESEIQTSATALAKFEALLYGEKGSAA